LTPQTATPAARAAPRLCLLAGAKPVLTDIHLFQSASPGERRLQGRMLERIELLAGGRLALSWIVREDFLALGLDPDVSYDLSALLRNIDGVEASILFSESGPAPEVGVKVSLRTLAPHDAIRVAALFGGGGHPRAAGCSLAGGLPEAKRLVAAAAMREFFPEAGAAV
jgi:phosphoesterase RecJ-like protein